MRRLLLYGCLLAGVGTAAAGQPGLRSVSPAEVPPFQPVTLRLSGSGFGAGCRAMLGRSGRFVPVATTVVDENTLEVSLPAGLPPRPRRRPVLVDCHGRRSASLMLVVGTGRADSGEAAASGEGPGPAAAEEEDGPATPSKVPVLTGLDPEEVEAGEPFTLTVTGKGFEEGAAVEVLANVNAGTPRTPDYRPRSFPAERLSDSVMIVDFDRGFAPEPRLRPVRVVNPSGARSAPLFLRISRRNP